MVSTKCSKICQRYLLSKLSTVKTVKDIYCLTTKNCQRNAVKTVKDIYCLN